MVANRDNEPQPNFYSQPEHEPFVMGEGPIGVLLIHGFPGTPAEMRPLARRLAAHGCTTQGILLPGFGPQIAHLAETGREQWYAAAQEAWQALRGEYETAVLAGFSMGALQLAVQTPPEALVLLAPFWRMDGWQFNLLPLLKHLMPSVAPFEKADFQDTAVRKQLRQIAPEANLDDPEVQQFFREEVRLPTRVIDDVRRLTGAAYDVAPQVGVPTLVLQGRQDETVTPANTRRLLQQIGGPLTYHEFPGDHTFPKMNAPDSYDFTQDVVRFLQREGLALATTEAQR